MVAGRARAALLGLSVLSFSCFGTTGPPEVAHTFPVRTYTLPSGLRVVVEQDDGSKLVGIAWAIDVGQGDDPRARPGLAHLVEHLLYSTPDQTGVTTWRRLIDLGANDNARTDLDLTTAYAFAPRAALDELVDIFLARVTDPGRGLDEGLLAKERRVVDEEVALRESTGIGMRLALNALADRPFIHEPAELRAALGAITLEDVRGFLATHYRPERMTLVLSGPIAAEWDRRFLDRLPAVLYGDPTARRAPTRHPLARLDGAPVARPEITPVAADVRERELWLAWPLPPARGPDQVPFDMVAELADRLLARRIESGELSTISDGGARTFWSAAMGAFLFRLELRPGADPTTARKQALDVLELLTALPFASWQPDARRRTELDLQTVRLHQALLMESLQSRTLERAQLANDNPGTGVSDIVGAVIETSLGSVSDVVTRNLSGPPARSILVTPRPGGRAGPSRAVLPASAAQAGTADADGRTEDEPASPHDARAVEATAQGVGAVDARVSQLPNGLTLIVLPRRSLPVTSMLLGFHADPRPGENPGVRQAASLARSFRLVRGPLDRAILQRSFVDNDATFDTFDMFASSANSALDLMWDEAPAWTVQWPLPAGDAWLQKAAVREATIDAHLSRSLLTALYGTHPYRFDLHSANVRAATESDLRAWIERVRRPANGALVIVGDVDPVAIARQATDALSDWSAETSATPPPPEPPSVAAARPVPILAGVDPSRAWTKIQFGCFLPPARTPRDVVVGELLTDALDDELFRRLRVDLGASYAPTLHRSFYRGGTHVLTGALDVDPKAGPGARDLLRAWLDAASPTAFDAQAVEKARWREARRSGLRDATNGAIARRLFEAWNMGWSPGSLDRYPQDLASVTPAEVAGALAACRASAVISMLAPP